MKIIPEECIISANGFTCFKKSPKSFLNKFLNNNIKFLSKLLTNEYIIGYICFRGCEFIIKDFLINKHYLLDLINTNNSYLFN